MSAPRMPQSASFTSPPSMSITRRHGPPRPVFLTAALRRILLQKTWRKRLRSSRAIASFLLSDAAWWLRRGVWQVPRTLRQIRTRTTLPILPSIPSPSVDIYVPPSQQTYLSVCLSTIDCLYPAPDDPLPPTPCHPVLLYVHGGAWGSGAAAQYAQLATALTEKTQATVLILSYRLYPTARMDHQVEDISAALRFARRVFPNRPLTVLAHSSGAQLVALALLRNATKQNSSALADLMILSAGPFDLMHHFLFEAARGVADVSPMLPAACAEDDISQFDARSPAVLAEQFDGVLCEVDGLRPGPAALEGELAAANLSLPEVGPKQGGDMGHAKQFPRTYIMTSSCDTTVPMYSSMRFVTALRKLGLDSKLLVYDFAEHVDFVSDWFSDTVPRDKSDLFDVGVEDRRRREACLRKLKGSAFAELSKATELDNGPTPYVRDVVRILKSLAARPSDPAEQV